MRNGQIKILLYTDMLSFKNPRISLSQVFHVIRSLSLDTRVIKTEVIPVNLDIQDKQQITQQCESKVTNKAVKYERCETGVRCQ